MRYSWFTWSHDADEISALGYYFTVKRFLTESEEIKRRSWLV